MNVLYALCVCRYSDLRRRYALEREGYETETAQLRARLGQVEKLYNQSLLNVSSKFVAPLSAEKSGPQGGRASGDKSGKKNVDRSTAVKGDGMRGVKVRAKGGDSKS